MRSTILLSTAAVMILGAGAVATGAIGSDDDAFAPVNRAELEFQESENAYETVHALRHDWLVRAETAREFPTVFIEMRCTEVTCLRWLESNQLEEIRYLSPREPDDGWPPTNDNGSIVVTLRTRSTVLKPDVDHR